MMKFILAVTAWAAACAAPAVENKPLYENYFEKVEVGKLPEDVPPFLVLQGDFSVNEERGNKFLELPGAPLDTFEALFGPTHTSEISVLARIHGTSKGRRFPTFGVGLNGVSGFKLQVSPAKKLLELRKSEEVIASAPYSWESDSWTQFRLQVRKVKDGEWTVEGKVWKHGAAEPAKWLISHIESIEPITGRASISGSPYADTPIRFDDLLVRSVPAKP